MFCTGLGHQLANMLFEGECRWEGPCGSSIDWRQQPEMDSSAFQAEMACGILLVSSDYPWIELHSQITSHAEHATLKGQHLL